MSLHIAGNQVIAELQLKVWKITQTSEKAAVLAEEELGIFRMHSLSTL